MSKQRPTTRIHKDPAEQLTTKLVECSITAARRRIPIILFRNTIEEAESSITEEVAIMVGKHIVFQVCSFGGFIPASFRHLRIFRLDEFVIWIMERKRELLLQCIDNLNGIFS